MIIGTNAACSGGRQRPNLLDTRYLSMAGAKRKMTSRNGISLP